MGEEKFVRESYSEYSELALPNDANGLGNLLGGKVMHLVDLAGAMAAMRHSRQPVVTASVDHMNFLHPVQIGQLVQLYSAVNRVFRTSMEVGVKVFVEDLIRGEVHAHLFRLPDVCGRGSGGKSRSSAAGDSGNRRRETPVPASRRTPGISPERCEIVYAFRRTVEP